MVVSVELLRRKQANHSFLHRFSCSSSLVFPSSKVSCKGSQPSRSDNMKRMACGSNIGNRTIENAALMEIFRLHNMRERQRERESKHEKTLFKIILNLYMVCVQ